MLRLIELGQPGIQLASNPAAEPSGEEIRAQLERIVACDLFVNSDRLCRFLRWAVERTLRDETEQLKEYSIGRDVFDRDSVYDPRIDSIVRVEARRLRAKLRKYYETEGSGDPVVILLRRGSYVPQFRAAVKKQAPAQAEVDAPKLDRRTVAVLPFSNLSAEPDQEFFCDGVSEEILNSLTPVRELRVVARASTFRFQQEDLDVKEAGALLGAGTLVEGTVRRSGKRLRVSARIVDVETESYIWTETFDRELDDIFAIQDEIAKAVVERLAPAVPAPHRTAPNVEAYARYLQGRYAASRITLAGFRSAIEHFEKTIAQYPVYSQPYAGLADVYNRMIYHGHGTPAELGAKSRAAAREALRLDPDSAEAMTALGALTSCMEWRWREGEELMRRALELQPSYTTGYITLSFHYSQTGDAAEAIAAAHKALELDPLSEQAHRLIGFFHYLQRDYNSALAWGDRALRMGPGIRHGWFFVGEALLRLGRVEEAVAAFKKSQEEKPVALLLGRSCEALVAAGRRTEAEGIARQLEAMAADGQAFAPALVYSYLGLGDFERALDRLESACRERWTGTLCLRLDSRFDPVRDDKRFRAVLRQMDLE